MIFNTEATVVRSLAYGENHVIVTLLTPSGKMGVMAKGAKKPQSRFATAVQLGVQGVYSIRRGHGMGTLLQAEVTDSRRKLREQLELAAYAAYFAELAERVAEQTPVGSEAFYRLVEGALDRLVAHPDEASLTSLVWEAKLLRWLGASPSWLTCVRCGHDVVHPGRTSGHDDVPPGRIAYDGAEGGLLCPICSAQEDPQRLFWLSPALARVLEQFSTVPWPRIGRIQLSADSQQRLRAVLRHQLTEYAGLSMKSARFLDSLNL
ncbi:MAG: DNA repair protein RecO [Alicyclobacillus herbarius]|uniref:DNA repair protein RecO n=1 Tax=Alicyclobacillus herbarius TaxID=122960 RepID=UPI0023561A31|nr:DNA repair protein RecO [Alicyclobacillus herbarius]MCL6631093.1 DNA repair protein RecO [Alicyclobacillus herbarius]